MQQWFDKWSASQWSHMKFIKRHLFHSLKLVTSSTSSLLAAFVKLYSQTSANIIKTHVRGFFDTDLPRSVGTLQPTRPNGLVGSKFNWPSEDQCQRTHSKWVFVFIPHLKSKYSQLIVSKLSRKLAICPPQSPWRLIVLVRSLRSAWLDTAWLVKSVTYFNLIG